jgi:hypothetical protein
MRAFVAVAVLSGSFTRGGGDFATAAVAAAKRFELIGLVATVARRGTPTLRTLVSASSGVVPATLVPLLGPVVPAPPVKR